MKHFFCLLFFMSLYSFSNGQTITGVISCENNDQPVIGASVVVKNSYIGTVTDTEGNYSIQVDSLSKKLCFSAYGFEPFEIDIHITHDTVIHVILKEEPVMFSELTITAYIIPRKPSLSYSRNGKVTTVREAEETKLLNIEKQWPLINNPTLYWAKTIYDHTNYPDFAWKNYISGTFYAKFKIDLSGNLVDLEVLKDVDDCLSNEVRESLKLMPNWSEYEEYSEWSGYRNFHQLIAERGLRKYFGIYILPVRFTMKEVKE